MRKLLMVLFVLFAFQNAFSQEFEMVRHQVQMGETVRMISRKYKVEPSEVYKLNKFAIDGVSKGMVLQILVPVSNKKTPNEILPPLENTDEIPQQTVAENPPVIDSDKGKMETSKPKVTRKKKGIQPVAEVAKIEEVVVTEAILPVETEEALPENPGVNTKHKVEKGETLFNLAKKYGVSVAEIKSQNEQTLRKGLQPGQELTIISKASANGIQSDNVQVKPVINTKDKVAPVAIQNNESTESKIPTESADSNNAPAKEIKHTVGKGETLFSLARRYNVSVDEIKTQNVDVLKRGLQTGQVLTIMSNK